MTDRFPVSHAEHDPLLVAAFAAGDLGPADRERAELLASTCADCGLLAADLRAIATATAALPPRARPRDFALSAEDADRLQRRGWRGLVRALAGPRSAALRPLATGLTTLGIAGLLLAAMPAIQLGGSAASPAGAPAPSGAPVPAAAPSGGDRGTESDASNDPAATATLGRLDWYAAQSESPRESNPVRGLAASPLAVDTAGGADGPAVSDAAPPAQPEPAAPVARGASPLVVVSGTFLILGLGLFGVRWTARRLSDG